MGDNARSDRKNWDEQELVDTTNLSAGTNYYPDSGGMSMKHFKDFSLEFVVSGGVTVTVEGSQDDDVTPDFVDITKSGYELVTNSVGNSSFVDTNGIVDFDDLNVKLVRVKVVTSDGSNAVQLHSRRR